MSMGKSVMILEFGQICEGYIDNIDSTIDDWPVLETSLYNNQKLIDMLNMAPGDQKVIIKIWGDDAGIKVDNDYYQVNNI